MSKLARFSRRTVRMLALGLLLSAIVGSSFGQDQSDCAKRAETQMQQLWEVAVARAGQVTYSGLVTRARACVEHGQCQNSDAMLALAEVMVDTQVVDIQREKVALMREFVVSVKSRRNDACAILKDLPVFFLRMQRLNDRQLARFSELGNERFGSPAASAPR